MHEKSAPYERFRGMHMHSSLVVGCTRQLGKGGYAFQADNPDFMNACGHSYSHGGSGAENAENAVAAAAAFVEIRPWNMSPRRKYGRQ